MTQQIAIRLPAQAANSGMRRPYQSPRLDALGELREMTRGGCMGIGDGGGSLVTQTPMVGDPTVCFYFAPYHQTP